MKPRLRIAMISPTLGAAFGLEQVLMTSVNGLRQRGHHVILIGEKAFDSLPKNENPILIEGLFSTPALLKPGQLKRVKKALNNALKESHPDVVHFLDQPHADLIDLATQNYPCVLTAHTVAPTCPASHRLANETGICEKPSGWGCLVQNKTVNCLNQFKSDLHRTHVIYEFESKRKATQKMKAIIAISRYVERKLLENGFSRSQVKLVYNPLPQWGSWEGPVSTFSQRPLLISACRLVPLKGLEYALRALKKVESLDWEYHILGEGPLRNSLEKLAKDLQLEQRVRFLGKMPREETLKLIQSATLFLQPNVGPEGFGLSVAEALSLGTPALAFDTPALNEIIEHGKNGLLVPSKNVSALAEAIQCLLQDNELLSRMGEYGKKHTLAQFSENAFMDSTLKLYQEIV